MPRPREDHPAAIARLNLERIVPLEHLAGTVQLNIGGVVAAVSVMSMKRWATEGRRNAAGFRVWLDVIVRGQSWLSSSAAVERFLAALRGRAG